MDLGSGRGPGAWAGSDGQEFKFKGWERPCIQLGPLQLQQHPGTLTAPSDFSSRL